MAFEHSGAQAVYAPNSFGWGYSDFEGVVAEGWEADGEMVRQGLQLHAEDDDRTQVGVLVREVFDDADRDRFVDTVAGALAVACATTCSSEPSSTGGTSLPKSASESRTRSVPPSPSLPRPPTTR